MARVSHKSLVHSIYRNVFHAILLRFMVFEAKAEVSEGASIGIDDDGVVAVRSPPDAAGRSLETDHRLVE